MRCPANTKRAAFLWLWILLVSSTVSVVAGDPVDGASARACVQLKSRSAVFATLGCTKFVYLRNSCDVPIVAQVRRTQRLFSGTLRQAFPVVVLAGAEQSLGCAWWSGAMAPSQHELLTARLFVVPIQPETHKHHGSIGH